MLKKTVLILSAAALLGGCTSKQVLKDQVREVIKENPEIVLEVMRENSVDVLSIVEQGIDAREMGKRQARFDAEIKNPYKPVINSERAMLGDSKAPVTIVEYTDFLCPYCSKGAKVVRGLVENNPEKFLLVFKHLPMHENSRELAAVFEALSLMDKDLAFRFHDLAFEKQKELYNDKEGIVLGKILDELGVDLGVLQDKLGSAEVEERLHSDEQEARKFGLDATPTFLINGVSVRGYLPADRFEKTIDLILEKSAGAEAEEGVICEDCLNKM